MARKKKIPKSVGARVPAAKRVKVPPAMRPTRPLDETLIIRLNQLDLGGPFCLTKITEQAHLDLLQHLRSWESMKVSEIFSSGEEPGKDYDVSSIPNKAARDRLVELRLDDRARISRLRPGGKPRLYGFRHEHEFYALWWDPEHEIYPSTKRRT